MDHRKLGSIHEWNVQDDDGNHLMIYPHKRFLLPLEQRVELIKQSGHKSQRQLAAAFGISKTQVFAILRNKQAILNMYEKMIEYHI